jgi:outer membrane protein assembly factor BamB
VALVVLGLVLAGRGLYGYVVLPSVLHSSPLSHPLHPQLHRADFKELIPEFFTLPEFLCNINHYNLGVRQDGETIDNVKLPPWCQHVSTDPLVRAREFVRLQRKALESPYVSANLHHWIDLIFGAKQRGLPAELADNLFIAESYEGNFDVESEQDAVRRAGLIGKIKHFGQTPVQLFTQHHPPRDDVACAWDRGLTNVSQVQLLEPEKASFSITRLAFVRSHLKGFSFTRLLLTTNSGMEMFQLSLNEWTGRIRLLSGDGQQSLDSLPGLSSTITTASSSGSVAVLGTEDGHLEVYNLLAMDSESSKGKAKLLHRYSLQGHEVAVAAITVQEDLGLLVSADTSGTVVFWDVHQGALLHVVQSQDAGSTITALASCALSGDVVVARQHNAKDAPSRSSLELLSINAHPICSSSLPDTIDTLIYVSYPQGNLDTGVALATSTGKLMCLVAHTLEVKWSVLLPEEDRAPLSNQPDDVIATQPVVCAMACNPTLHQIVVATRQGRVLRYVCPAL